ncbi:MAG: cell division protein SepF [Candidatus Woesearchaeota archaeon]
MRETLTRIKEKIIGTSGKDYDYPDEFGEDYLEIDHEQAMANQKKAKVTVRPFIINEFGDIKEPLDVLREGYTIVLLNIRGLKANDMMELKRAVSKIKKTIDAAGGDIAGFGEDWIVVTPSFAEVYRAPEMPDEVQ